APEDRLRINLDVLAMICRLGAKTFPIVLRELSEQGHGCIDPNGAYRFWGISVMPTPIPNCADPDPGWIYAIGDKSTRLIKIGKSTNPRARLAAIKGIRSNSPHCGILGCSLVGSMSREEDRAHLQFKTHRKNGEW